MGFVIRNFFLLIVSRSFVYLVVFNFFRFNNAIVTNHFYFFPLAIVIKKNRNNYFLQISISRKIWLDADVRTFSMLLGDSEKWNLLISHFYLYLLLLIFYFLFIYNPKNLYFFQKNYFQLQYW